MPVHFHITPVAGLTEPPPNAALNFNEDGSVTVGTDTYTLDYFQNMRTGLTSFSRFVFPSLAGTVEALGKPFELTSQTAAGKVTAAEHAEIGGKEYYRVTVVFYPDTTSLRDALWRVNVSANEDGEFSSFCNVSPEGTSSATARYDHATAGFVWLPSLALAQIQPLSAESAAEIEVRYHDRHGNFAPVDCEIRVKSDAGYLPKTKLRMVGGVARFKLIGLGLELGDQATVKAGIDNWTSLGATTLVLE